ncbi:MAG: serine hydrolase domain-containing protein [Gemmataceae bacterium]
MPSLRLSVLLGSVLVAALVWRIAFVGGPAKADAKAAGLLPAKLESLDALLRGAVERQQIAGGVFVLARHGRIGHLQAIGWRDAEARTAMTPDTLFRLASLTKPITSVAVMMLVEDGKLRLNDPLSKYVPEFKEPKVTLGWLGGAWGLPFTQPALREITIHDLLTHTSGLSYRFWERWPLSFLYRDGGVSDGCVHPKGSSRDNVRRLAKQPLLFHPGFAWEYGLSTDVLGVVVEAVSGQDLSAFFRERIFEPLKMHDTFFVVPEAKKDRLAPLYQRSVDGKLKRVGDEPRTRGELVFSARPPCEMDGTYFSGGSGLISTASDYARFLQMLLNGGELDGARLLRTETVQRMTSNQIGNRLNYVFEHGDGFGYGFGVRTKPSSVWDPASTGTYSWSGLFNTYFWVDPKKELIGVFMTQMMIGDRALRSEFTRRAYECLAD